MRLFEIDSSELNLDDIKEVIERDCKTWLLQANGKFAVRRTKDSRKFVKIDFPKNRVPRDFLLSFHKSLVKAFNDLGFVANRHNSLFTATENYPPPDRYGPYTTAVFPIGDFDFTWSPNVPDLLDIINNSFKFRIQGSQRYGMIRTMSSSSFEFDPTPLIDLAGKILKADTSNWEVQQKRRDKGMTSTNIYTDVKYNPDELPTWRKISEEWTNLVRNDDELREIFAVYISREDGTRYGYQEEDTWKYYADAKVFISSETSEDGVDYQKIKDTIERLNYRSDDLSSALDSNSELMITGSSAYVIDLTIAHKIFRS